jgi:geranylgeranyl diphosphate synthase type II
MDRPERSAPTVERVRDLMDSYGSIEFSEEYATGIAGAAIDAYEEAFAEAMDSPDAQFIRSLVPFMVGRSW